MNHIAEEQLVLYYYGEAGDSDAIAAHLAGCAACREDLAAIQATLNLAGAYGPPERDADYEGRLWSRLRPQLRRRRSGWFRAFEPRRWAAVAAMLVLVVAAYWAGRWPVRLEPGQGGEPRRAGARLAYLGDHLERSQMLLTEVSHADEATLGAEQRRAEDLLAANRLLRLSLQGQAEPQVAETLDALEPLLTELANAGPEEIELIRRRLKEEDLLFKVRVLNAQLHTRRMRPVERSSD